MVDGSQQPKSNLEKKNPGVIIAVVVAVLISAGLFLLRDKLTSSRDKITPKDSASALPKKDLSAKAMTVPSDIPLAAVIADVNDPAALKQAAEANVWLKDAISSPLGRGFSAGWTAFFGSTGEDLKASFRGTVLQFFFERLLTAPFSVVWFGGEGQSGTPALIIDGASGSQKSALEAMDAVSARGTFTATHCPGQDPPVPTKDKEGKEIPPPGKFTITRWLVADHAVFAAKTGDRVVLAAKPTAVLQGLCVKIENHARGKAALEVAIVTERFGREAQALSALLGLQSEVRIGIAAQNGTFVPVGLSGVLAAPERLATQAVSDEMLKAIPEDMPVTALLQLALPAKLDEASLAAHLKGEAKGAPVPRSVALVWNPHGSNQATEIALLWSRADDEAALKAIFSGRNALQTRKVCGQIVLASTAALADRMEKSCKGGAPSRNNASAAVVTQAKATQSVALQVQVGALLATLLTDAYKTENPKATMPKEIEQAKQQLEALPFFGFKGKVEGKTLVAEGFRS